MWRWIPLLFLAALNASCRQPDIPLPEEQDIKKQKAAEEDKDRPRQFHSEGGTFTIYDKETRHKRWLVRWKSAELEYSIDGYEMGGKMDGVTGILYEKGKEASTFIAGSAFVERGSKVLNLAKGVFVKSTLPNGSLRCESISYDSEKGIADAKGKIEVRQFGYIMTGVDHVKAKTNLSVVATPDMF